MWLEVLNSLVLSHVLTERQLQGRSLRAQLPVLLPWLVVHVLRAGYLVVFVDIKKESIVSGTTADSGGGNDVVGTDVETVRTAVWYYSPSSGLARHLVAILAFTGLTYADIRRACPDISLRSVFVALVTSLPAFSLLFVIVAVLLCVVFLALAAITDAVGIDEHYLDALIFYGVFYLPWASLYVLTKRAALKSWHKHKLLPA